MPSVNAPTGSTLSRPGCSVIVQPVGNQTKPTVYTRTQDVLRKLQLALSDVSEPAALLSWLQRFQENIAVALRPIGQNPLATSLNILQGVVFTAGQTLYLQHGLGHAYSGWWCVRAQGNPAVLVEAAFPAGTNAAQVLPITSTNGGTYSLAVF